MGTTWPAPPGSSPRAWPLALNRCVGTRNDVDLTLTADADDRTARRVERRTYVLGMPGAWGVVAALPASATTHTDTAAALGTTYGYRVTNLAGTWTGSPSGELQVTTRLTCL